MKLYFLSPPVPAPLRSLGRRHGYRLEHMLDLAAGAAGPARVVRVGGAGVARAGPVKGPGGRGARSHYRVIMSGTFHAGWVF